MVIIKGSDSGWVLNNWWKKTIYVVGVVCSSWILLMIMLVVLGILWYFIKPFA